MAFFRSALLGAALVATLAVAVHAQGDAGGQQLSEFQLMNGRAIVVSPAGVVAMRAIDDTTAGEVMHEAHPMAAASIMFMSQGKLYAAADRPTQGGAMLSDTLTRLPRK